MKLFYLKCLLFGILSLTDIKAYAYDCYVNGIYYNLDRTTKTASVTYQSSANYYADNTSTYQGSIVIPSSFTFSGISYTVTSIGDHAFIYCYYLTYVVIPSTITSIESNAFSSCSSLTSMTIPNSVTSIGNSAFYGSRNLSSVTIGNSVTSIWNYEFEHCSGLKFVTIPNSVTTIGYGAFSQCSGLTSVTIGNSVTNIGSYAFSDCIGLTSVTIPNSVTNIGSGAFSGCSGLTFVTIGNSVTNIGSSAFSGCSGLTKVNIFDIAAWCNISFGNASSNPLNNAHSLYVNNELITNLVIPNSVTRIRNYAFSGCTCFTSINIPSSVIYIGSNVFNGTTWYNNQPNGLIYAGKVAYKYKGTMPNNSEVIIDEGTKSIADLAFQNCSGLTSIKIPNSVISIGSSAFSGCSNISNITSEITDVFVTGTNAFSGCENATLHVPAGTYVAYSGKADWNRIIHIVESSDGFKMMMACNTKGNVLVNDETNFTSMIGEVDVKVQEENTFVFIPKNNCKLEQVCLNGFDITSSVENNTLKAVIPAKSQMVVTFAKESGDMNNDGIINISDVVMLVNMILGQ